jgi:hypothetical protein
VRTNRRADASRRKAAVFQAFGMLRRIGESWQEHRCQRGLGSGTGRKGEFTVYVLSSLLWYRSAQLGQFRLRPRCYLLSRRKVLYSL